MQSLCTNDRVFKMIKIEGQYILDTSENFKEYLLNYGFPESIATLAEKYGKELMISIEGKKYIFDDGRKLSVIILDEEYDEEVEIKQIVLKSMAKLEGNKIIVTSEDPEGNKGTRVHEFTDSQYILTMTYNNVSAKRCFNRI